MSATDRSGYTFRRARRDGNGDCDGNGSGNCDGSGSGDCDVRANGDVAAIAGVDDSFTTDSIFRVSISESGFALTEVSLASPLTKQFPAGPDDEDDEDDAEGGADSHRHATFVAADPDGAVVGFVSVAYARWNRRLSVCDLAIAPAHRGRGVGTGLMACADEFARDCGARHVWLEVTNVNAPAIHAYRRMGFAFCGLDASLYEGTASAGEYALYMSKPVAGSSVGDDR
ncbi:MULTISPECIES: GNAT family N-acetyltransferase [Prauserella salsuginis group]|uniref:GNAT family N-acetyltransferase n=1 Tax=Prauserella salsuginis TaxID=387889 RepID=A0ABW6G962_9PSEU|nr:MULTISPECIES: GNAT family N-acetyltransferase [Prauserella salsuginis group]MCR3719425.1 ribosomal-protein-alanine N-acetyltransferase [Prauserella flava]MCR3735561.1 ribosomal-protein-alanine N-acetyltransferase [Prauserella salsuginis]